MTMKNLLLLFFILLFGCASHVYETKQEYARSGFYEEWYEIQNGKREGIVRSYWRGFLIAETSFKRGNPIGINLCAVPGTTPINYNTSSSCYTNSLGMTLCGESVDAKPNMFRSTYEDCMKINKIHVCELGSTTWAGGFCDAHKK